MRGRVWWLWAAVGMGAAALYYWLCLAALQDFLDRQAAHDEQQLRHGFRWEFSDDRDLAGPLPPAIAAARLRDSVLRVPRAAAGDYLSLNLRGEKIDARVFTRLSLGIDMQRESEGLLFFRESLDGPDLMSQPLLLHAGQQDYRVDLSAMRWNLHPEVSGAVDHAWGGRSGTVASVRLHPVAAGQSAFAIDWVALLPQAKSAPGELVHGGFADALEVLAGSQPRVLVLSERLPRPARVMELRRRIEKNAPASSLRLEGFRWHFPGWRLEGWLLLIVSAALTWAGFALRRNPRRQAAAALAGILLPAAGLLLSPPNSGEIATAALGLLLLVNVAIQAAIALWPVGRKLLGGLTAWRRVGLLGLLGLLPLAPLTMGDTLPPAAEFAQRWLLYLPWAAFQQTLLCALLEPLCRRLAIPATASTLVAAGLFGLVHFPNFELMLGTFFFAGVSLALYRRQRAILPLVVLHATFGGAYLTLLPASVLYSGTVGMAYFSF